MAEPQTEKAQKYECPTMCDDDCEARCHEWHLPPFKRDHRPESCERAQVITPGSEVSRMTEKETSPEAETDREVAAAMTGLWQAERERADRLEAMLDRLAERLVVLPDLWREEGRAVLRNAAGDDLTVHQRVGKWLHEKTAIPPAEETR